MQGAEQLGHAIRERRPTLRHGGEFAEVAAEELEQLAQRPDVTALCGRQQMRHARQNLSFTLQPWQELIRQVSNRSQAAPHAGFGHSNLLERVFNFLAPLPMRIPKGRGYTLDRCVGHDAPPWDPTTNIDPGP